MAPIGYFISAVEDLAENIPVLNVGQQYFATDTQLLYVGTTSGNVLVGPAIGIGPIGVTGTPSVGQVPTATGPTAATWQTPGGGGSAIQHVRSAIISFTQGGVVGPIQLTFGTPFADNNYTASISVVGDEAAPGTPTVTQFPSVGVSYAVLQAAGAGVTVWVCNNDSIAHSGVVHVMAVHD